jgi:hypothetical protein
MKNENARGPAKNTTMSPRIRVRWRPRDLARGTGHPVVSRVIFA